MNTNIWIKNRSYIRDHIEGKSELTDQFKIYYDNDLFEKGIYIVKMQIVDKNTIVFNYRFLTIRFADALLHYILRDCHHNNIKLIKGEYIIDPFILKNSNLPESVFGHSLDAINFSELNLYIYSSLDELLIKLSEIYGISNFIHVNDLDEDKGVTLEIRDFCKDFTKFFDKSINMCDFKVSTKNSLPISEELLFNSISGTNQLLDYKSLWLRSLI